MNLKSPSTVLLLNMLFVLRDNYFKTMDLKKKKKLSVSAGDDIGELPKKQYSMSAFAFCYLTCRY